jgi:hypothetical protein
MDAHLRGQEEAQRFLDGDIEAALAAHGVDVNPAKAPAGEVYRPQTRTIPPRP